MDYYASAREYLTDDKNGGFFNDGVNSDVASRGMLCCCQAGAMTDCDKLALQCHRLITTNKVTCGS